MEFRTIVNIPRPSFQIEPLEEMLFVGSCFADSIGRRFQEEKFRATVNPYGVMYNPASVLHTVERCQSAARIVFVTLGTNHVYRLKATGEIVDNCQKRPHQLFSEESLTAAECADYLRRAALLLQQRQPAVRVVLTVSPIRYAKYGFHESQLSKATLLLAADQLTRELAFVSYFPAYEIVLDELRDYRFYKPDMLHPSEQAVEFIWQQLVAHYFSVAAKEFLEAWQPVKQALNHRPFNPQSEAYRQFAERTRQQAEALKARYPGLDI